MNKTIQLNDLINYHRGSDDVDHLIFIKQLLECENKAELIEGIHKKINEINAKKQEYEKSIIGKSPCLIYLDENHIESKSGPKLLYEYLDDEEYNEYKKMDNVTIIQLKELSNDMPIQS